MNNIKQWHKIPHLSAIRMTGLVGSFYTLFTVVALARHKTPLWFVWIGERFAELNPQGRIGYDGQFIFYIARDGLAAAQHLDIPAYRLQRILLPAFIRLLTNGNPTLIPWLIIIVNLVAIIIATYLLARWLEQQKLSPWYALIYACYVGTLMAYSRDLTEPLALCLAIGGCVAWLNKKQTIAIGLFALAILTKETMLLFVVGIGLTLLQQMQFKQAIWLGLAGIPLLLWEVYLWQRFGTIPLVAGPSLTLIPLAGILPHLTTEPGRLSAFFLVGLPALCLFPFALYQLYQGKRQSPALWWLFIHCVFVLLMPNNVYDHIMHAGRNASGLIVAFIFCLSFLPTKVRLLALGYTVAPTLIWLLPIFRWAPWLSEI